MAQALTDVMTVASVSINASEGSYLVPLDAVELLVYTDRDATEIRTATGVSSPYKMNIWAYGSAPLRLNARALAGKTIYFFNATVGATVVSIMVLRGTHG